jgi:O-antigen ligase
MSDRQAVSAQSSANGRLRQLFPIVAVFYSFLILPPEVEFAVFGVNLTSYRIALIAMSVPGLWMTLRSATRSFSPIDLAIAAIAFWIMLSFTIIYGFESGLVRGAGITIDTVLPYFVARACVKSLDDIRYFLILCVPGLAFVGSVLALESLSGRLLMRPAFASVFGAINVYAGGEATGSLEITNEYRLGLLRAYGPFAHPILAGISMAGFLPLYYFSGLRSWPFLIGLASAATGFFGLSSAAFLALILAFGAILIYHSKAHIPKLSWWTISCLLGLLTVALHMASQNGLISVISRLTLTPHTAEYRTLIWEYGSVSVTKYPWFGIGYRQWERLAWMGESVDAHFLLLGMRHGLLVPILLLIAMVYGMIRLGLVIPYLSRRDRAFAIGINVTMVIFLAVGQTVHYFGSSNVIFMTMIAFLTAAVSFGDRNVHYVKHLRMLQYSHLANVRANELPVKAVQLKYVSD